MISMESFEDWLRRLDQFFGGFSRLDPSLEGQNNMAYPINDQDPRRQSLAESARLRYTDEVGASSTSVKTFAQHGFHVCVIDQEHQVNPDAQVEYQGDGLITCLPDVTLMVLAADCPPIWLVDQHRRAWGLLHAGWQGTMSDIVGHALLKMHHSFGVKPEDLQVYIGPGICLEHYQRDNVWQDWQKFDLLHQKTGIEATYRLEGSKVHWGIIETNIALLQRYGVQRISRSAECTFETPTLASARRHGRFSPNNLAVFGRHGVA